MGCSIPGPDHSPTGRLARRQPPECVEREIEAFLLIGAAYLHDVGTQCVSPEFWKECGIVPKEISDEEMKKQIAHQGYDLLENIRAAHPSLSERMIKDACRARDKRECQEFDLNAQSFFREAQLMAVMSRYHCEPISKVPKGYSNTDLCYEVAPGARMMLLIHLLRIGDALDADARRLNKDFLERHRFETIPAKGQFHLLKHACTACIERVGVGDFKFHYTFPPDVDDIQAAVQRASGEVSARTPARCPDELLNSNRIALMTISSEIHNKNMSFPYPFKGTRPARSSALL